MKHLKSYEKLELADVKPGYMYKDNNSLCIKKTNKNNTCRVWSDEYNKMKKLIWAGLR